MSTVKEIQVRDLPLLTEINDTDVFLIETDTVTYKVTGEILSNYIANNSNISDTFITNAEKGVINGIVPLDSSAKIDAVYLSFGETRNTIYEGSDGKALESKANNHIADKNNPHKVTKEQIGLENVENKSSETIRSELTKENVTAALGYTPETDESYEQLVAYVDKKIADLIDGAPETIDTLNEVAEALSEHEEIVEALNEAIGKKANQTELDTHTTNSIIHITQTDKDNLSIALSHSNSTHANIDATKTSKSDNNGNIKINDTETVVYEHPLSGVTAGTYRQVVVDSNGHITSGNNTTLPITQGGTGATTASGVLNNLGVTATASELNILDGITATTEELNHVDGVTSNIQSQLNGKADVSHGNHLPEVSSETNGKILKSISESYEWGNLTKEDIIDALGYTPGASSGSEVTGVKGDLETTYRVGNVNITPENIGLGKVDNTSDNEKAVLSATKLTSGRTIQTNLESEDAISFNGSTDITTGVVGVLPISHGGTGASTTSDALTNLGIKAVTTTTRGLMTAPDKVKLDGIENNANNYSHPITSGNLHIPSGGSAGQILRWIADGVAAWGDDNNSILGFEAINASFDVSTQIGTLNIYYGSKPLNDFDGYDSNAISYIPVYAFCDSDNRIAASITIDMNNNIILNTVFPGSYTVYLLKIWQR